MRKIAATLVLLLSACAGDRMIDAGSRCVPADAVRDVAMFLKECRRPDMRPGHSSFDVLVSSLARCIVVSERASAALLRFAGEEEP